MWYFTYILDMYSRKDEDYIKGETRLWDITKDVYDPFQDVDEHFESTKLSFDKLNLKIMQFHENNDNLQKIKYQINTFFNVKNIYFFK